MIIPIDDRYRIQSTKDCWQVARKRVIKGVVDWVPRSHHMDLSQAVNSLYQERVRLSDAETLVEALADADRILRELTEALSPSFRLTVDPPGAPASTPADPSASSDQSDTDASEPVPPALL